jgi:hypothetical protein
MVLLHCAAGWYTPPWKRTGNLFETQRGTLSMPEHFSSNGFANGRLRRGIATLELTSRRFGLGYLSMNAWQSSGRWPVMFPCLPHVAALHAM